MLVIPAFGWRPIFFGITFLGVIVWVLLFQFMPESPRWLASKGRFAEADAIVSAAEKSFTDKGVELPEISQEQIKAIEDELGKEPVQLPYRAAVDKEDDQANHHCIGCSHGHEPHRLYHYYMDTDRSGYARLRYAVLHLGMTFIALLGAPFRHLLIVALR